MEEEKLNNEEMPETKEEETLEEVPETPAEEAPKEEPKKEGWWHKLFKKSK